MLAATPAACRSGLLARGRLVVTATDDAGAQNSDYLWVNVFDDAIH